MMLFRQWRMTFKQFSVLVCTGVLALLPMLYSYARQSNEQLRRQAANEITRRMDFINQTIDSFANNIRNAMVLLSSDRQLLTSEDSAQISLLLYNYASKNTAGIKMLYYALPGGLTASSRQTFYDILGNDRVREISRGASMGLTWYPVGQTALAGQNLPCSIGVTDDLRRERGVLVAECDYAGLLNDLKHQFTNNESAFCLFDQEEALFAFSGTGDWIALEEGAYPYVPERAIQQKLLSMTESEQTFNGLMLNKSTSNILGWTVGLISRGDYYTQYDLKTKNFFISSALLLTAVLLVISAVLTFFVMRPLGRLVVKMRSITSISDLSEMKPEGKDEIGQLVSSYNEMTRTIQRLMQETREREAMEMKMLRSQIGPHFLYNTLSCVGSLARQGKAKEASEAIRALIKLLSFSFDKAEEDQVELWEELESLDSYVDIQLMRHGPLFHYSASCPDALRSCRIPKLTLQPLVENAIFHGLLPSQNEKKIILVQARAVAEGIEVTVKDNGIGMDEEAIRQLMEGKNTLRDRFSGIGVHNVRRRLELRGASLRILSHPGEGTQIQIILPTECT